MLTIKVRYEDGKLVLPEPLPDLEGQEFWFRLESVDTDESADGTAFVTLPSPEMTSELKAMIAEAQRSQGIFADSPEFDQAMADVESEWQQLP